MPTHKVVLCHTVHLSNSTQSCSALIQLKVASWGPKYKSGARILQECSQIKVIGLEKTGLPAWNCFKATRSGRVLHS